MPQQVNDMDMKGITREEAVLFLLSLQDQIHLIVQNRRDEYEHVVATQRGDSFHIKWVEKKVVMTEIKDTSFQARVNQLTSFH